jgi:hypothetical protein
MFWWLLLAALGAALIVLWVLRSETRQRPTRPRAPKPGAKPKAPTRPKSARPKSARPKAPATPGTGPQPGEIWWADVPYEDYSGHKVRPCVVIRVDGVHREVLKITSQDQSHRDDHVRIPTKTWDPGADHDSYLDLTGPVLVAVQEFEDQAGTLDPAIWRKVKQLYKLA